jgi:hypothetical protein
MAKNNQISKLTSEENWKMKTLLVGVVLCHWIRCSIPFNQAGRRKR